MKISNLSELNEEISRVKRAINSTTSPYLKKDYKKYLNKLYKEKREYTYD